MFAFLGILVLMFHYSCMSVITYLVITDKDNPLREEFVESPHSGCPAMTACGLFLLGMIIFFCSGGIGLYYSIIFLKTKFEDYIRSIK